MPEDAWIALAIAAAVSRRLPVSLTRLGAILGRDEHIKQEFLQLGAGLGVTFIAP